MAVRVARADAGGRGESSTDRPMILVPSRMWARVKACSSAKFRVCDREGLLRPVGVAILGRTLPAPPLKASETGVRIYLNVR